MKDKEFNKMREELNKSLLSVMGFDEYDVISLTKEEFLKKKLPLIKMAINTQNIANLTQGFSKLRLGDSIK